jgi:hypothetical protein
MLWTKEQSELLGLPSLDLALNRLDFVMSLVVHQRYHVCELRFVD